MKANICVLPTFSTFNDIKVQMSKVTVTPDKTQVQCVEIPRLQTYCILYRDITDPIGYQSLLAHNPANIYYVAILLGCTVGYQTVRFLLYQ